MSLKDRLRRLTGEEESPAKPDTTDRAEQLSDLRRRLDAIVSRRPGNTTEFFPPGRLRKELPALQDLLTGCEECNDWGAFFRIDSLLEGTETHGIRRLNELETLDMEATALLANDTRLSDFDSRTALFLDTETTGLAGGTGTLAFLVGVGWFEADGRFLVRQLFARSFEEERAVLAALQKIAASKRYLVTFNGKSFDINLLATRYILNRLDNPLTALPHLDLLHPARRLFGHRISNSRLITLEEALLKFYREDDLPGSEVPMRYFNWLRSRDPHPLLDVFRHNRLDITALAALTVHLAGIFNSNGHCSHYDPSDLCAAARLFLDRGRQLSACSLYEDASRSASRTASLEARQALSLIHKKNSQWEKAVILWEDLLKENPNDLFAAEELAKWHEHRTGNLERALQLVDGIMKTSPPMPEQQKDAWRHRFSRLQTRCEKAKQRGVDDKTGAEKRTPPDNEVG